MPRRELKPEIQGISIHLFDFLLLRSVRSLVHFIGKDVDGFDWADGADGFAAAAADAEVVVDVRERQAAVAIRLHAHRLHGAMFRTGTAGGVFFEHDAEAFVELRDANLRCLLLFRNTRFIFILERNNRMKGAHIGAHCAIVVAKRHLVERQVWLKRIVDAKLKARRFQNLLRTVRYAQMAGGAFFFEML